MPENQQTIGCILMASGMSERYGRNKLLEPLEGREVILHTAGRLRSAGLRPLAVTRSPAVRALMAREGFECVLHDGPRKGDTMREGLQALPEDMAGYLFMPADQPLVTPESLKTMIARFLSNPARAVRLGFEDTAGSPVIFPAFCRQALMDYSGDRGGLDVLRAIQIRCDVVQAGHAWELWDVDTPEDMAKLREAVGQCTPRQ